MESKTTKKNKDLSLQLRKEAELLSYEESMQCLDEILELFQNESMPIEEIQKNHLLGKIYLERCEDLLNKTEQEIVYASEPDQNID